MALVTKNFSDIITFTRTGSTATYFNSAGVLTTTVADQPRFDYNPATLAARGLLIEEARANLLTYSDQFDNLAWVKATATVTANATASPDGTVNADKLIATAVSANHYLSSGTVTISAGASVTASVYVKAAEYDTIRITAYNSAITSGFRVDANLSTVTRTTGTLGTGSATSSSVTNVGGGWYRVTVSGIIDASSTGSVMWVQMLAAGVTPFLGDGTSGIFVFGAQLEAGAFPTSYIPTTTTALTRNPDVASVNTLSPWFNSTTGTIYVEFLRNTTPAASTFPQFVNIDDGSINNRLALSTNSSRNLRGQVAIAGVFTTIATANAYTEGAVSKLALGYQTLNHAAVANGGTAATDTLVNVPSGLTTMRLGDQSGGAGNANGYLRRITYYPRRLSNAELQAITA